MADKQRSTSRRSPEENQNLDNERNPGQNNRNDMSRDVGLQTGGIDHTDRNTSDQSGQSPEVTGPSNVNVFNTEGPVQQGAGATIIQNPTYHNCNNQQHQHHHYHYHPPSHITSPDQYLQWMEQVKAPALGPSSTLPGLPPCPESRLAGEEDRAGQSQTHRKTPVYPSQHGNSSSYHVPCHCQDCMVYHQRQHLPLAALSGLESESRHSGQTHHQPVPQLLPTPQNTEQQNSTKKGKQHQANPRKRKVCQRSSRTPQPSSSDVRPYVSCTERSDEREGQSAQTVRSTHETRPVNNDGIPDSVCIMDSRGQSLEPGDAVWFMTDGNKRYGIYVGGQEVVWSEETDRQLVHIGELKLTDPFGKFTVHNGGGVRVFPPEERVDRAKSRVGSRFTEGDRRDGWDFHYWIFTGMGGNQALIRGFRLWP